MAQAEIQFIFKDGKRIRLGTLISLLHDLGVCQKLSFFFHTKTKAKKVFPLRGYRRKTGWKHGCRHSNYYSGLIEGKSDPE